MVQITADEALLARLREFAVPVEIRDAHGAVLGHYTPVMSVEMESLYEKARGLFDFQEIERRFQQERGSGISLADFWMKLEAGARQVKQAIQDREQAP